MLKHLPKSIWFVTLFIAIVLGIVPGIALRQNTITIGIPLLLGWLALPVWFTTPSVDYISHIPEWLGWLVRLYYPLALLLASICAYWTVRSTGGRRWALLIVGLLACVATLICIPVSMIAPSLNSNGLTPQSVALSSILALWFNLLFSGGLGWCIACLIPRPKRVTAS